MPVLELGTVNSQTTHYSDINLSDVEAYIHKIIKIYMVPNQHR